MIIHIVPTERQRGREGGKEVGGERERQTETNVHARLRAKGFSALKG